MHLNYFRIRQFMPNKPLFFSPLTEEEAKGDKSRCLCLPLDNRILFHAFDYNSLNFKFHTQSILSPVSANNK